MCEQSIGQLCSPSGREARPAHPGEVVADLLADAGLTQGELALRLGISRQSVNALLRGRRAVTPDMAHRLGRFFGNGPELWLSLQANVDMWDALAIPIKVAQH